MADDDDGRTLHFMCPGCKEEHVITGLWHWNGDAERPTFKPSVLVRSGHYAGSGKACWCTYNAEHPDAPAPFKCSVCHTFVTDGQIQFLGDCTHELAGQTVAMVAYPDA